MIHDNTVELKTDQRVALVGQQYPKALRYGTAKVLYADKQHADGTWEYCVWVDNDDIAYWNMVQTPSHVCQDEPEECIESCLCSCGHTLGHHRWNPEDPVNVPWKQVSGTGKSYWKRYCRGHKGYDTLVGETPCRCKGYDPVGNNPPPFNPYLR